jgi:hypothetical protein
VKIDRFALPGDEIEELIHRDALALLGLADFHATLDDRRTA